jgi:Flp pilus assembly protein TadD
MNSERKKSEAPSSAPLLAEVFNTNFLSGPWPFAILLLIAVLPYIGILRNDFAYVYDDKLLILDNPYVHNFHHLREILGSTLFSKMGAQERLPYYRPMADLTYLVCYQIFGPLPFGFHLASLTLNAAVVVLVFLLVEQHLGDRLAGFCAATLFALHPVHVEVVAWATALIDLDVAFFCLLTFWCFLETAAPGGGRKAWAMLGMTFSFILAIFSKELAIMIPLLAAVYEHFYRTDRQQTTNWQKMIRYGPMWIVCFGYFLWRLKILGGFAHNTGYNPLSRMQIILSALALIGQYLGALFWPIHLSAFHLFHPSTRFFEMPVILGAGGLALGAGLFCLLWKWARPASFGILWFFLILATVLNARWMSAYVFGERHLYLSSAGFCLVAGWACSRFWQSSFSRRRAVRTAAVVAACVVAALCVLRVGLRVVDWRDDVALYTKTLAADPDDFRIHGALGSAFWIRGESAGAEREWQEELRLEPNSISAMSSLGMLYAQQMRFDQAFPFLENAVRLDPSDAHNHLNLGAAYAETGKLDLAEEQFAIAVRLAPMDFGGHNVLGKLYFDSHRLTEAEQQFRQSLQCEPNLAAYDHLGYIYMQWGDAVRAEGAFHAALAMKSTDSHAHFNLGLIYAATGRNTQAVEELQAALAADPNNPDILSALEKLRH